MSISLILLVIVSLALGAVGIVDPRRLLHYPVAVGLLMLAFIIPQAYAVERLHLADLLDPAYSWRYFTLCIVMVVAGWVYGRRAAQRSQAKSAIDLNDSAKSATIGEQFNLQRLAFACAIMAAIGAFSFYQMASLAAAGDYGSQWTGVITLYYLLSGLLVMSLSLSWLTYLGTGNRVFLFIALFSLLVFLPMLTVSVKRSWIFEVGVVLVGGLMFARHYAPPRIAIVAALLFGTILLHQVGNVREYVRDNNATAVSAIADGALTENLAIVEMNKAPEVQGAVTRIAISRFEENYEPGVTIWNRLMHQYVPAFLVGKDIKDALKFESSLDDRVRDEFFWSGATSTGFADSFSSFWWFGSLCFFVVSFMFARFWEFALQGDLRARFLYLALLNDGLVVVTESVSRFIASLPFILVVTFAVFWFTRSRPDVAGGSSIDLAAGQLATDAMGTVPQHAK